MLHAKVMHEKGLIKNKKMITQSQFSQVQFMGRLDNTKLFYNSLKAINFSQDVNIILSENGFKAIAEDAKHVQAIVYVTKECFSEYKLMNNEEISFRVNLGVVCDCLSIFTGVDCSMKMIFKGNGAPLVFVLEQHGDDDLVTECSVKTKNGEEPLHFSLDDEDSGYNTIILRGVDFAHLLGDINKSTEELEIYMSPDAPHFRLTSLGVMQSESNIEVARTSDIIIKFSCKSMCSAKYKMSHIRIPMRAITLAPKVALRTDSSGLLGLQLMVLSDDNSQIYIEYFITPLCED